MMKLGAIEFDDCVLDAVRDDRFVVFAGAGVSMGPPSNLASFWKLTCDIAQGTGLAPSEPLDRFLGQLDHHKVAVHERAAQLLSPAGSAPNALHHDLLRLFRTADRVRLVTTNFDLHFETAASALFDAVPDVYCAPALPLGYDFTGIVHVHGALPKARNLVLTDTDFGRAYLTEGWARRFLVDVFRRYTVLFVGYSHDDVVMNYLARALPADSVAGRFALTDEDGRWELLGIKPIHFMKGAGPDSFKELYDGVKRLAECTTRGALDWESRLAELGSRVPPTDEEAISEVEQALCEVYTTRFLLNAARGPDWLRWLNGRKHLDALFSIAKLGDRDTLLAGWLAQHFAIEHPDDVFEIVAAHGLLMNPFLWWSISGEVGAATQKPLEESALKRWATILLQSAPCNASDHILMRLAERCERQGCVELTLKTFMTMSEHRLTVKPGFPWPNEEGNVGRPKLDAECPSRADYWSLNKVWTQHLRPHLPRIVQPLLSAVTRRLEEMHGELKAWDKASREWDPFSFRRSAIEPHGQDQHSEAVDVLIDAARDALECLAKYSPSVLNAWIEILITSDASLLRRLAVHAMTVHPSQSPEERLTWLLDRVGLHELSAHHEVHRAVALNYPFAADPARSAIVDAVIAHTRIAFDDYTAEERTARAHFDWLTWLVQTKPDCAIAGAALAPLKVRYPEWMPSEHPDLTYWTGAAFVGSESPWSVEQLLDREPVEQFDDMIYFSSDHFDVPSRSGLLANVREACKQKSNWAFGLAQALEEEKLWQCDLWSAVIQGLRESDLTIDEWRALLALTSTPELQSAHAHDIANACYALVKDDGKPFALELLEPANSVALSTWQALVANAQDEGIDDWLFCAINRPAGVIVEFWLSGLSLLMHGKTGAERFIREDYRRWFSSVVEDSTSKGGMGRTLLAAHTAFLFGLDKEWTRQHVIPLFSDPDPEKFAQAWDGFLVWGRLYPALAEDLMSGFLEALTHYATENRERRRRFIEFYTALALFHVSDPTIQLLPALFQRDSLDDRIAFASHIGYFLGKMQQPAKKQLWDRWLHRYWRDRLQGLLRPLDEAEVRMMLEWIPDLGDTFAEAVALAVQFPVIRIEHSHFLYELRQSDLVTRFPTETAEFLIYISKCNVSYQSDDLAAIAERLTDIPEGVRMRLVEAYAIAGLPRSRI